MYLYIEGFTHIRYLYIEGFLYIEGSENGLYYIHNICVYISYIEGSEDIYAYIMYVYIYHYILYFVGVT